MRRSTLNLWIAAAVLALGVVMVPAVQATSEDERPGEIGILAGVGFGDDTLVGQDNDSHVNPLIGGRFGWHFTDIVAGFFEMTYVSYEGDPNLYGNVGEYSYLVGPEWYLNHKDPWQCFINLGVGGVQYQSDFGGNDGRGFGSVGLGVRRGWEKGALRMDRPRKGDVGKRNGAHARRPRVLLRAERAAVDFLHPQLNRVPLDQIPRVRTDAPAHARQEPRGAGHRQRAFPPERHAEELVKADEVVHVRVGHHRVGEPQQFPRRKMR